MDFFQGGRQIDEIAEKVVSAMSPKIAEMEMRIKLAIAHEFRQNSKAESSSTFAMRRNGTREPAPQATLIRPSGVPSFRPKTCHSDWSIRSASSFDGDLIEEGFSCGRLRSYCEKCIRHPYFESVTLLVVVVSCVLVGVETNIKITRNDSRMPDYLVVLDVFVLFVFVVELLIRIIAAGSKFITGEGRIMNLVDSFLVITQIMEEFVGLASAGDGTKELNAIRMLRICRVVRTIRLMRKFKELRLLFSCLEGSWKSFAWSLVLISMILFVGSIVIVQVVHYRRSLGGLDQSEHDDLLKWFGSLPKAMLTLFMSITGGADWRDIVEPLDLYVSGVCPYFYAILVSFMQFSVLNVVSAVFVEGVIRKATHICKLDSIETAAKLFQRLDGDDSGAISLSELTSKSAMPHLCEFFQEIDIDPEDMELLFLLFDLDNSKSVSFDEFLSGCLRLQEPAKAVDMLVILRAVSGLYTCAPPGVYDEKKNSELLLCTTTKPFVNRTQHGVVGLLESVPGEVLDLTPSD